MTAIETYLANHDHQSELQAVYDCLKAALPAAEERLSYGMPAFWQGEMLIYFAPMKHHLVIYPTNSGVTAFAAELAALGLTTSKGSIHLPYDRPLPLDLVRRIALFRLGEVQAK